MEKKDNLTDTTIGIDFAHHEIHDGDSFIASGAMTDVNFEAVFDVWLITPLLDNGKIHVGFSITSNVEFYAEFREMTSTEVFSGTDVSIFNKNRNSANTYNMNKLKENCTGVTPSKAYYVLKRLFAGSGKSTGGSSGTSSEIILKPDTYYQLYIINRSSQNIKMSGTWELEWYLP